MGTKVPSILLLMPEKQMVKMTALTEKLESMMQSRGVSVLKDSTIKHIRRKLESELENSIHIFTAANGQLVLVPDSVTLQHCYSPWGCWTGVLRVYC